jgi:hypothetical protein
MNQPDDNDVEMFYRVCDEVIAVLGLRNETNAFKGLWDNFQILKLLANRLGYPWVPIRRFVSLGQVKSVVVVHADLASPHSLVRTFILEEWEAEFPPPPTSGLLLYSSQEWDSWRDILKDPYKVAGAPGVEVNCIKSNQNPLPPHSLPEVKQVFAEWKAVVTTRASKPPISPWRGPGDPGTFWWDGVRYRLSPKP